MTGGIQWLKNAILMRRLRAARNEARIMAVDTSGIIEQALGELAKLHDLLVSALPPAVAGAPAGTVAVGPGTVIGMSAEEGPAGPSGAYSVRFNLDTGQTITLTLYH